MKELNAEQIIKALECCTHRPRCRECPYTIKQCENVRKDALALIKELTEKNEKIGIDNFNLICELSRIRADAVRELQDELITFFNNDDMLKYNEVDAEYINEQITKIAKKVLEGGADDA